MYDDFIRKYPSVEILATSSIASLKKDLESLGLIKRAKYLKKLARVLQSQFNGSIPQTHGELLSLPMVGRYTANAVRCFAFSEDEEIVDSNVIRIIGRYYGLHESSRSKMMEKVRNETSKLVPPGKSREFNWALLDLAALVCLPHQPKCKICPLRSHCAFSIGNIRN